MPEKISVLCSVLLLFMVFAGCERKENPIEIDTSKTKSMMMKHIPESQKPINIAVGSMITPKAGFAYYQKLLKYIEKGLSRQVKFVDKDSYAEINKLIKDGLIDVGFVCGKPYVDGHEEFGMELLVAPQAYGETVYYSYIIVQNNSSIQNLAGLRGKIFAFADPMSNTGKLVPTHMLAKMGETPDTFFQRYFYTYAHDKSIMAVAQGMADGAAVDSLIWEFEHKVNPELTSKTRIIFKSSPYGIPPVVVRPDLDVGLKEKVREILLHAHEDKEGKEILKGMMIEKFVMIDDSSYDSIREMKAFVTKK